MNYYNYQGRQIFTTDRAPQLDSRFGSEVAGISGLDNIQQITPYINLPQNDHLKKLPLLPMNIEMTWENFVPQAHPTTTSLNGFSGANLKTTYKLSSISRVNNTTIDGDGETLIITNVCGINNPEQILSDANLYNTTNGLPLLSVANFAVVNADGTPFTQCNAVNPTGWEKAIALDIAAAHTLAPGANIVLVLAQNQNDLSTVLSDLISYLISSNFSIAGFTKAYVVSNNWGAPEGFGYWPIELALEQAAAYGMTVNFAAGNCGDTNYGSANCVATGRSRVQYPASSAWVTAVGGTSVFVDNNWNYAFESNWGTYLNNGFYFGTGGGISQYFGPVCWQAPIYYFRAGGYGPIWQNNRRAIPDISMLGDPFTGLTVYEGGSWSILGGTGLSSALFSATTILINQARTLIWPFPIGLVAPYLYTKNSPLLHSNALYTLKAPHQVISGAELPPVGAPTSAFTINGITFGWNSSLTIDPQSQFWNDAVGVGSPSVPNFVKRMSLF